jgi:hypothetical protein
VLCALHLLFNEGYWSGDDEAPIRADLCRLAMGLARALAEVRTDDPEVRGLLALLPPARRAAAGPPRRVGRPRPPPRARPLPLGPRGHRAATRRCSRTRFALGRPGPFQIEAAIAAVHCRAPTAEATDWREVAALYALLEERRPTHAVRAQRAFAVARAEGARPRASRCSRRVARPRTRRSCTASCSRSRTRRRGAPRLARAAADARNRSRARARSRRASRALTRDGGDPWWLTKKEAARDESAKAALFWSLVEALQAEDPRVVEGTLMNGRCARVGEEFLALVDYKGSGLVVKLPPARVEALLETGVGRPFAPAGRVFKRVGVHPDARPDALGRAAARGRGVRGAAPVKPPGARRASGGWCLVDEVLGVVRACIECRS